MMTPSNAPATMPALSLQSTNATRLRRIVVGTDFSDESRAAVMAARDLAALHGAHMTVVHATDPIVAALEISPEVIIEDARIGLQKAADAAKADGVIVTTEMRLGKPWWAIREVATEIDADLVVVASHGRTDIARVAMGSTADRVLRSSNVPVLVIPVAHTGPAVRPSPRQWKHGLVAVDFSDESLLALQMGARVLSASVSGKNVLTLFHTVALTIEFRGPEVPVALPQHWDQAETAATQRLEQLARQVRSAVLDVQVRTFRGYPSDGILHEARSQKVDFIAMGTQGRGALNRMMLGSVAERVLHHAPCAILTARHRGATPEDQAAGAQPHAATFRG